MGRVLQALVFASLLGVFYVPAVRAQSNSTGAIAGTITDASGAAVPAAQVTVINLLSGEPLVVATGRWGQYELPFLAPGLYRVIVTKVGFAHANIAPVTVAVTQTATTNIQLQIGPTVQTIDVTSPGPMLQTHSAETGSVTAGSTITRLPLVSRNYLQIVGLNPGIATTPTNAADIGRGGSAEARNLSVNGGISNDNNFEMNGIGVNDVFGAGVFTGGVPTPSPDAIEEFKVVTSPYDASNGHNAAASVDVITKAGSNQTHGTAFEFLRNSALNANDFFANRVPAPPGQRAPRGVLDQNQFGAAVGGPIVRNKLQYFGSYQGTRQRNGLTTNCASEVALPPLSNDRSAAAIAKLFNGQRGYIQTELGGVGPAIDENSPQTGYNINPIALKLLQMKGPDGGYLIPTPQTTDPTATSFDSRGLAEFSQACTFTGNQYIANFDWLRTEHSQLRLRFFTATDHTTFTLPGSSLTRTAIPGFPYLNSNNFYTLSLTHTHTFSAKVVNRLEGGFNRSFSTLLQGEAFGWSDLGSTVPFGNAEPAIGIAGVGLGGGGQDTIFAQNTFDLKDDLAWVDGRSVLHLGAEASRSQINSPYLRYASSALFPTFADFLLGLNAQQNGTAAAGAPYSNELLDAGLTGELGRYYRLNDGDIYLEDQWQANAQFTVTAGLRWEHLGDFYDTRGRAVELNLARVDPQPGAGSLAGYVVPSNYPLALPSGVVRSPNRSALRGAGTNVLEPRIGFAWRVLGSERTVLRGGYGTFSSSTGGLGLYQAISSAPFAYVLLNEGPANAAATLANPLPQPVPPLPQWVPYQASNQQTFQGIDENWQPATFQHYGLDMQWLLSQNLMLEAGYAGSRGTHLAAATMVDQAQLASPAHPIRGVTDNTVANVAEREPYMGFSVPGLVLSEPRGASWYNALDLSLQKRFSSGLQFLVSYTWARDLTDVPGAVTGAGEGTRIYGNQLDLRQNYGPEGFIRPQRLVVSYRYDLPDLPNWALLRGWSVAGVTTIQSGDYLSAALSNDTSNIFGVPNNKPNFTPGCVVAKSGSVESRLSSYFNTRCFRVPVIAGTHDTTFGDAPVGNITGPREVMFDASIQKDLGLHWLGEASSARFRTDFFNLFNHPVFGDPSTDFNPQSSTGVILGPTVVNPRVIQFGLKLEF